MKCMIPKTIHYCWFGRNPKPKLAKKCIKSWKKYCPGYEIIEWNEDNFDISSAPLYVRQAYEAKKWAFVTDYVRLKVVYDHGGIYLDTDVELVKSLDPLLNHQAYFGFEGGKNVNTGLGFGAQRGAPILLEMMQDYYAISFVLPDGGFDTKTCPVRNTEVFLRHGLKQNDSRQVMDGNILILPSAFLCPIEYETGIRRISPDTVSIHHFSASWQSMDEKKRHRRNVKTMNRKNAIHTLTHIPHRIARLVLGDSRYEKLKQILK